MQPRQTSPPAASPGINLGEIYHILFRHKWKIISVWVLGFAMTVALWIVSPKQYQSEAELFIRYVLNNRPLRAAGESEIQQLDPGGQGIINAEIEILGSFDVALEVADAIGPTRILAKAGGGSDRNAAAALIHINTLVEAAKGSSVIHITFKHPDRELVQTVLNQYISSYKNKHMEIHQSAGAQYEFLTQQTDQLHAQLTQTEEELRKAKAQAGVTSLDESKKACAERITAIQTGLSDAEAELAEQRAILHEVPAPVTSVQTNAPVQKAPPDKVLEYRRVCGLLNTLERREQELLVQYTPASSFVREVRVQILENQKTKNILEAEFPQLTSIPVTELAVGQPGGSRLEIAAERIRALEARITVQKRQMDETKQHLATISNLEGNITELQRKKESQEQNYRLFSANLEKARIDETLGDGRISNISGVQAPSPPFRDLKKVKKKLMMLLFGSFAAGPALAFVLEMYLDRSFKRPIEIETKLHLPLFMSIPRAGRNGKSLLTDLPQTRLLGRGDDEKKQPSAEAVPDGSVIAPWQQDPHLRPFFEALRDRLIMSFELRELTHNPKLVAVTSCGEGSGVSTVASGLAASLSETGEGNVLLVDMNNIGQGAAHYFRKGKLECGLDEALEMEKRGNAMVQDNLYVVAENASNEMLPRVLHKRFSSLLPKLKASDYDYIIFDMPPVSQISPTPKLARFMDMVFMVVEAEKTDRDAVQRATSLLEESKAQVGIVLNKTHEYVPRRLRGGA